jgi:hypothetical protein
VDAGNGAASVDFDLPSSSIVPNDSSGDEVVFDGGAHVYKYVVQ